MKLDLMSTTLPPSQVGPLARQAEQSGFDGLWVTESNHNPFVLSALAANATEHLLVGTDIAVALARSPMVTAQAAWGLAELSGGRFVLGLGTQVKTHLEKRFGVPGDRPVARLREYILALRAIFDAFAGREKLNFEGEFYRHVLLPPFFSGGKIEHPDIPIYVAGVNHALAYMTGEVADGFCAHPVNSPLLFETVVLPAIAEGAKAAGRNPSDVQMVVPVFVAAGDDLDAPEVAAQRKDIRLQIAFYGTTPSYKVLLEAHGWGDVAPRLTGAAKAGDMDALAALISDEMLDAYAVTATWDELPNALIRRFDGMAARVLPYNLPAALADPARAERWSDVARTINRGDS